MGRGARHLPKRGRSQPIIVVLLVLLSVSVLVPAVAHADEGLATWYGEPFHGRTMANGQTYDMYDPTTTAANMWPFGTWLKVTNPANGRSIVVQVRDRGKFTHALDLSYAAFKALDDPPKMSIRVRYEVVPAPSSTRSPIAPQTPSPSATPQAQNQSPQPTPPPPAAAPKNLVVAAGDTLLAIARRFNLDAAAIARWNDLADPNRIRIGQQLLLVAPSPSESTASSRGAAAPIQTTAGSLYTVVAGDTLWGIAGKYGTTPDQLATLNGVGSSGVIVVGQQLKVATSGPVAAPAPSRTGRYTVQDGDSLLAIALKHGTTVAALMTLNGLTDADFLQVGQVIALP